MANDDRELQRLLQTRLVSVNAGFLALVSGFLAGLGLFIATNWLVLKAGAPDDTPAGHHSVIAPHLSLLGQYFIGYRVSFVGSLVGFAYAFACAAVTVYLGARLYNWVAGLRHRPAE